MKAFEKAGKMDKLFEIFLSEVLGTAMLMYFGCMGLMADPHEVKPLPPLQGGLVWGFTVSSIIAIYGHLSKAHLNPSVSLCSLILGIDSVPIFFLYVAGEMIGALLGVYLLQASIPSAVFEAHINRNETCGFCTTALQSVSVSQGILIEFIATSMLIYMVCSVWDPRNVHRQNSVPIMFGLLIAMLSIVAGPFTGASLNPARTFAPALLNRRWDNHWIYWLAPLSGSAITTLTYKYVFLKNVTAHPDEDFSINQGPETREQRVVSEASPSSEKTTNLV